jgi:predicted nucleic acid-binding Zn ribbon protein
MVAKPNCCVRCSAPLPEAADTGRPARYCGDSCKRLVEYEVRRLDRRIAAYELELREELADRAPAAEAWIDNLSRTRAQRINDLRRWIDTDTERLQMLLAGTTPTPRA